MKQQKRGKFFTFVFSLIPGAAEMYMGFMKKGVSLMALFLVSIMIPATFYFIDFLFLIPVLVWFYGFFHARNLAVLPSEDFQLMQDTFIWEGFLEERSFKISNPTLRKWGAITLIVFGVVLLWDNVSSIVYRLIPDYLWDELYPVINRVPQVVIAVLIIIIGLRLMAGKKEELNGDER